MFHFSFDEPLVAVEQELQRLSWWHSRWVDCRDHRVHPARNMQEARSVLEQQNFDVIIADLQIAEGPNGSGLESWLAENKPALSRKLIWMCAVAPSDGAAERVSDSNSRILQKPFKVSELLAAVDELLLNRMDTAPIGR